MLIILDRDGVINRESPEYIKSPEEWLPLPGSLEAIAKLKYAGHQVVVATNQSGIARGLYSEEVLAQIHAKMLQNLDQLGVTLDGIFYCPHQPEDQCNCRKPKTGMLLAIGKQFQADLQEAWCVGDSLRDLQAAVKVGAKPVLVLTGNGEKTREQLAGLIVPTFKDLAAFAESIS
jgi:D-glycero-D-manno-heptose 1,7-bisphosphate phosphatase